ncbi:MAG TPA: alpha/beta hydrolase [Methylophilaceae bacterium]|nr:alpha/beta hydrolase [Methylophilaceae bacterium]
MQMASLQVFIILNLTLGYTKMHINKTLTTLFSTAAILLTTGCSPVKTLNLIIPESGYQLTPNIAFGSLPRQKLDIYVPKNLPPDTKPPVVVFFYGGGWESGDKSDYKFVAEALTSRGFITVIPDYRVYPDVLFPGLMADPAQAARWVKDYIAGVGGDPQRIFLAGHSAGAHIAAMLTLDDEYLSTVKLKPADFRGMIGLAGPYDFLPLKSDRLKTIFGPEDQRAKSQPINFVTGHNPPMLLMVGKIDGTVWPRNTYNLAAKIREDGGPVEVVEFENYGHIDMVAKLAKPLRNDEMLGSITNFIKQH